VLSIEPVAEGAGARAAIHALVERAAQRAGHPALDEKARLELAHGVDGFVGFVAGDGKTAEPDGYAHLSRAGSRWSLQVVVDPELTPAAAAMIDAALTEAAVQRAGADAVRRWVFRAIDADDHALAARGWKPARDLVQYKRALPTGLEVRWPAGVRVRDFVPGRDEDAWLRVNHRAFRDHAEQGHWDRDALHQREHEPWFDPRGFLIAERVGAEPVGAERDGGMAGFCWTKLHDADVGEIYVIAVDPAHQGIGLGRALVLGGLESLAARGATTGMLYVDAVNEPAVALYEALGFRVDHVDRQYERDG